MFQFIRKIQQKPEAVRKKYVLFVAAITTAIIFLIWVTTIPVRYKSNQTVEPKSRLIIGDVIMDISQDTRSLLDRIKRLY